MWKNHLKVAWRNLGRQKGNTLINVAGLSVALAVSILILLWVQNEYSVNKFHTELDRIFMIKRTIPLEGNTIDVVRGVPYPLMKTAQEEIPEVEKFIPIGYNQKQTLIHNNQEIRAKGTFSNAAFFEAFSFPILQGDISQLDTGTDGIAISKSLGERLFGNAWQSSAVGKSIEIHDLGNFTIKAIYEDFPTNSSLQNEFVYSLEHKLEEGKDWLIRWTSSGMSGAVLLVENSDPVAVGKKMEDLFQSHLEGDFKEGCFLHPFADNYLFGNFNEQGMVDGGRIENVRLFTVAAVFLLLISCINFMNLSTARASTRAKEVGVRKVVGAGKNTLIRQFLTEAALLTFISVVLAIAGAKTLLPYVENLTETSLTLGFQQPIFWVGIAVISILTVLLAGAYPAFVLSSFSPKTVLRSNRSSSSSGKTLRKALVIVQFVLALFLIVGAIVIQRQVDYVLHKNLGLDKDNLIVLNRDQAIEEKYSVLKEKLLTQPSLENLTSAGPTPLDMQASTSGVEWPGKQPEQSNLEFQILWAESNFLDVFGVEMLAGEFYKEGQTEDTLGLVLNERAIEVMNLEDPVGKTIHWWGQPRMIRGVVKNFHNRSLHDRIEPIGILLDPEGTWSLFIKYQAGKAPEAIASIESTLKEVMPGYPFYYEFVDEQYQRNYKREMLISNLARYFAFISIFISCLGLLGLITFSAIQRKKEIGIRKVLGASVAGIVALLSREYLLLIGIALLIATPITWYLMQQWLQNFYYGINMEWSIFLLAGIGALCVALLTVSFQSIKAALANPVESLRNE